MFGTYDRLPAEPPPDPPSGLFPSNDPLAKLKKYNIATAIFVIVGLIMTAGIIFKNLISRPVTKAVSIPIATPTPIRFNR
jgi:hypothetical protein